MSTDIPRIPQFVPIHFILRLFLFVLFEEEIEKQFDFTFAIICVLMGAQLQNLEVVKPFLLHSLFYYDFLPRLICDHLWVQSWNIILLTFILYGTILLPKLGW